MDYGTGVHDYEAFHRNLRWLFSRRVSRILLPMFVGDSNALKELSEALAVFRLIYEDSATRELSTVVVEACAGRRPRVALLVATFIRNAIAVSTDIRDAGSDVKEFAKKWWGGKKLLLRHGVNMFSEDFDRLLAEAEGFGEYRVLVGVHCCKQLAVRLIDAFATHRYHRLILVPCCADPSWTKKTLGVEVHGYLDWVYALAHYAQTRHNLDARVHILPDMLSDANAAITAQHR